MKRNIFILILLLALAIVLYFVLKPKIERTEVSHDMVVQQIEELGKLELVKYNIRDIVEYKKMREWLPNSKTALIVVGEVVACIDLTLIKKEDVIVTGDSVSLTLPLPEICHFKIDHSRSHVYDVQYGLFDTHKLVDAAYREAEQQIYTQALEMGIADQSRQTAVKMLTPLLNMLGFKKVSIHFAKAEGQGQTSSEQQNINITPTKQ